MIFMDLDELKELYNKGIIFNFVYFWKSHNLESEITNECLSQWYICDFEENGVKYNCCEQYMMAKKAELFGDKEIFNKIMEETKPKIMKQLGRSVRNFDTCIWIENRINIVENANYLKFSQNDDLKEFLLSTGDSILVEASPFDLIWGVGISEDDENITNPNNWKGENYLGFILMNVRDRIKNLQEC